MANTVGKCFTKSVWRTAAKVMIFLLLIALPFVDEVVGKYQFESLCTANGIESADVTKAKGKKVKVEYGERQLVHGTILPIKESDAFLKNADSGEVLIRYKNYYASGGWLMRYTWISLGTSQPMIFGGFCDRRIEQEILRINDITFIYK